MTCQHAMCAPLLGMNTCCFCLACLYTIQSANDQARGNVCIPAMTYRLPLLSTANGQKLIAGLPCMSDARSNDQCPMAACPNAMALVFAACVPQSAFDSHKSAPAADQGTSATDQAHKWHVHIRPVSVGICKQGRCAVACRPALGSLCS